MKESIVNMIEDKPMVFFDLETTGINVDKDQIVQISMIKVTSCGMEQYESYVMPDCSISDESIEVHGITLEKLKQVNAPKFAEIAKDIKKFIDGCCLSGYNIKRFDMPLLENELNRAGLQVNLMLHLVADVFEIVEKVFSKKLTNIYKLLSGQEMQGAHDASADTIATIEVLEEIISQYGIGKSVNEWISFAEKEKDFVDYAQKFYRKDGIICFNFGESRGNPISTNPGLLNWMLNKDFPVQTKAIASRLIAQLNKK